MKVPVGALFREGEGWAVFVVHDAAAAKRAVKVTRRNGLEAMVEDGLQPGERVIVYPSDALRDGTSHREAIRHDVLLLVGHERSHSAGVPDHSQDCEVHHARTEGRWLLDVDFIVFVGMQHICLCAKARAVRGVAEPLRDG